MAINDKDLYGLYEEWEQNSDFLCMSSWVPRIILKQQICKGSYKKEILFDHCSLHKLISSTPL